MEVSSTTGMKGAKEPIEICEEAAFLLRHAKASVWICYFIGTIPFVLALLYFWSDMTRGNPRNDQLIFGSLRLAGLFVWMKTWQSIFARRLRDTIVGQEKFEFTKKELLRIIMDQARWQSWGLIVLPICAIVTIPLGWTFAYYQNLTALGAQEQRPLHQAAVAQAKLWPGQNHWLLLILFGVYLVLFVNVLIMLILLPQILITFFGVKELFHPSFWLALNTTFLALVFVITHLLVDPFIKSLYVLRCFYGQSETSGEDLRVRLRHFVADRQTKLKAVVAAALFACVPLETNVAGADLPQRAEQFDKQIDEVLKRPEYSWKLPREIQQEENRGAIAAFFDSVVRMIGNAIKAFFTWLKQILDWIRSLGRQNQSSRSGESWGFGDPQILLLAVLGITAIILVVMLLRSWHKKVAQSSIIVAQAAPAALDLHDEQLGADALPQDEWLKLANQLQSQGDLRLAIRALFLSALADLARREIVSLAKFKSNRDYERELRRRSASVPERTSSFAGLVRVYEQTWYGWYEPSSQLFHECEGAVRFLRSC